MTKQKKHVKRFIRVCPKCKSPDTYVDNSNPLQSLGMPALHMCNVCRHSGYTFPEVELGKIDKFEKDTKQRKLQDFKKQPAEPVDTAYGNFIVEVLWRYGGPIAIVGGLIAVFSMPLLGGALITGGGTATYLSYRKRGQK